MKVIGSLAMIGAVLTVNYDGNLSLALAIGGGFTLVVENLLPSYSFDKEINKSTGDSVEHHFVNYDLKKESRSC
jgi:hypothetical protein